MKNQIGILLVLLVTLAGRAQVTNLTVNTAVGTTVPDGSLVGLASSANVSGMSGSITNVTVNLNITGGFNGDLYCYLLSPQNTMIVLLNRVGLNSTNPFSYDDAGMNITLSAAGLNNIHNYQDYAGYSTLINNGSVWAPDQRDVDPQTNVLSAFDTPSGNNFNALNGSDPNGAWTLFIADVSGGGTSTLVSWGLTVVTVPEPQTWALLGGGLAAFSWLIRGRRR